MYLPLAFFCSSSLLSYGPTTLLILLPPTAPSTECGLIGSEGPFPDSASSSSYGLRLRALQTDGISSR